MDCYAPPSLRVASGPAQCVWPAQSVGATGAHLLGHAALALVWPQVEQPAALVSSRDMAANTEQFQPYLHACDSFASRPSPVANSLTGLVFVMPVTSTGGGAHEAHQQARCCEVPNLQAEHHSISDCSQAPASSLTTAGDASPGNIDGDTSAEAVSQNRVHRPPTSGASASRRRRRQRAFAFARKQRKGEGIESHSIAPVASAAMSMRNVAQVAPAVQNARPLARAKEPKVPTACSTNTWNSRMMTQLEAGGEEMRAAVSKIRGRAAGLAFDASGCRVLQMALRTAGQRDAACLTAELRGRVRQAISSPHANYVIQAVVEVMPTALATFVADELRGAGAETSRHKYGCRIMCRLLEHSAGDPSTLDLIDETLQEACGLCYETFGHHVMESVLEHGMVAQKRRVAAALLDGLPRIAMDSNAAHVIISALRHCGTTEQSMLVAALVDQPSGFFDLAEHRYGNQVVRALLGLPGEPSLIARKILQQDVARLQGSPYGRTIADEIR